MNRTIIAVTVALLFAAVGCNSYPDIKPDDIERDIVGKNAGEGVMSWTFAPEEARRISILEVKKEGRRRTVVIEILTESKPQLLMPAQKMGGKLRLHYEWIANEWILMRVENLTFRRIM